MAIEVSLDARLLAEDLRRTLQGEVRFDAGGRALYATDASNYRHVPIGVVYPRSTDDVVAAVAIARQHGAPVLARGGGTSIGGQTCNAAVVLDFSRHLDRILDIDPDRKQARVQPGVVLDTLRAAAERHHLTFGPDPATHAWCTLGGMIGNNSCGVHSVMAGKTVDNVDWLDILTYDGVRLRVGPTSPEEAARLVAGGGRQGEIYGRLSQLTERYADLVRARYPNIPRRVSGYNLDELLPERGFNLARALVGSEGTCAVVLEAGLRLVDSPPARVLLVLGYPDMASGGDRVPDILAHRPIGLEGIDDRLVSNSRKKNLNLAGIQRLPEGGGWLLVEFGADTPEAAAEQARGLMRALDRGRHRPTMRLFEDPREAHLVWAVRESALGATANAPGEPHAWEGWEDTAVPPDRVGAYLRDLRALFDRYGYVGALYGHLGEGCIHTRINFDLRSAEGVARFRSFVEDGADLVVRYGGSISGEHGDGQARAELLVKMFGPELVQAFREFKAIWDPEWKLNPGKLVEPRRLDQDLRLLGYRAPQLRTHFQFPDDHGSFAEAALRCVGVGRCRKTQTGTMCPSYMATGDEMHSTRGRARLLFEMLQGETLTGGWQEEHLKEALDLCLACKACKSECPVQVDMATYKAEFLAHYYTRHARPLTAYLFGLIHVWARLGARVPGLANLVTRAPLLGSLSKRLLGVAPERQLPAFAPQSFRRWFQARGGEPGPAPSPLGETGHGADEPGPSPGGALGPGPSWPRAAPRRQVLLWTDTFTNYFHPQPAIAAVQVLEWLGFEVVLPDRELCCGRPTYDWGFLPTAKRLLRQTLTALRPHLEAGVPILGLEPSCVAVFRDELPNLFPDDPLARQLSQQVLLLAEFLDRFAPDAPFPPLSRPALVHGHCHQRAVLGMQADERVLRRLGVDYRVLDSGCCGMAGAFGYEAGQRYEVSRRLGERALLPAVRAAPADTLLIADGFSCREQIAQGSGRRALHLAEVVHLAVASAGAAPPPATG